MSNEKVNQQLLVAAKAAYELLKVIHDETGKVGLQLQSAIADAEAAQPAEMDPDIAYADGWNACRRAMLSAAQNPK